MHILGIDTTAVTATAAVCAIEGGAIQSHALFSLKNGLTHSENLLYMIDAAMGAMKTTAAKLDLIAVSAGPGSFTGVRIGVSMAKGLAFPHDTPVCGVSTLDALGENIVYPGGIVCPVMDARRNQFYNALFQDGKRLTKDRCVSFSVIYEEIQKRNLPVMLCGDGAALFHSLCENRGAITLASPCQIDQNALSVALCGYQKYQKGETQGHAGLKPVYLRLSQAERIRNENKQTI